MTWWNKFDRQSKLIIGGLGLLVLSQFLNYVANTGGGTVAMFGLGRGIYATVAGSSRSGWSVHGLFALLLLAPLAIYALDLKPGAWWTIWGKLITALLVLLNLWPASFGHWGTGFYLGIVAAVIAWLGLFGGTTPKLPPPET